MNPGSLWRVIPPIENPTTGLMKDDIIQEEVPTGTNKRKRKSRQDRLKNDILHNDNLTMNKIGEFLDTREHIDKTEFDVVIRNLLERTADIFPEAQGKIPLSGTNPGSTIPLHVALQEGRTLAGSRFPVIHANKNNKMSNQIFSCVPHTEVGREFKSTLPDSSLSRVTLKENRNKNNRSPLPILFSNNILKGNGCNSNASVKSQRSKVKETNSGKNIYILGNVYFYFILFNTKLSYLTLHV